MTRIRPRRWLAIPVAAVASMAAAQLVSASSAPSEPADSGSAAGDTDLTGICPETVKVMTDWFPEAEHGWLYQLVGDDPVIEKDGLSVTGPLVASGNVDTGVDIEIISGAAAMGPGITVTAQLYERDDLLLGYVYTDEAIQFSATQPTVAIFSGMEKNPQIIMWDPATYPDVETIADLGEAGVKVRYFEGAAYMEYFAEAGILSRDQLDSSYQGGPADFVAAEGADAQQGFGSAEPYIYEHEVPDWGKPVAYQYINDAGWTNYGESIATRPENLETYADCFAKLVPMLQQSSIDFLTDPAETNALILEAVETYDSFWVYSQGVADYAVETMINDGLMSNGPDDVLGNFDLDRVTDLIEKATPIYSALGQVPAEGLTAEALVTNEFIDPSIGLPADLAAAPAGSDAAAGTEAAGTEAAGTEAAGTDVEVSDAATETTAAG